MDGFAVQDKRRGEQLGIALGVAILLAWAAVHVGCVFFWTWTPATIALAPIVAGVQCWLCVGLFIIAHDCMHGSFAPGRPRLNAAMGRLCLGIYAGFDYTLLRRAHFEHHRAPGTEHDPDFCPAAPTAPLRWYAHFLCKYMSLRNLLFMNAISLVYVFVLHADLVNVLVFWAAPAIVSSFQLFWFGTYLPHRHEAAPFADSHRARSSGFSWLVSLLTCFHFGYHHEHHVFPHLPWFALPTAHRARA